MRDQGEIVKKNMSAALGQGSGSPSLNTIIPLSYFEDTEILTSWEKLAVNATPAHKHIQSSLAGARRLIIGQFSSVAQSCLSLQPHGLQLPRLPCPSPTPTKLMSVESVMPSNHLILCHPLLLLCSVFPSIRVFFNESVADSQLPHY